MKAWSAAKLEFSGRVKNYFNEINLFFLKNNAFEGYSIDVDNQRVVHRTSSPLQSEPACRNDVVCMLLLWYPTDLITLMKY